MDHDHTDGIPARLVVTAAVIAVGWWVLEFEFEVSTSKGDAAAVVVLGSIERLIVDTRRVREAVQTRRRNFGLLSRDSGLGAP